MNATTATGTATRKVGPSGPAGDAGRSAPAPGTVPDPVAEVLAAVSERVSHGAGVEEVAGELAQRWGHDRVVIDQARLRQVQAMHGLPSDDFHATRVLRALERALARLPLPPPELQARRGRGRRWWRRSGGGGGGAEPGRAAGAGRP